MKSVSSKFSVIALLAALAVPLLVHADPIYNPGDTLNPTCAPTTMGCTVFPMAIGASVASGSPGSIPFIDEDGALEQDNGNLKWDNVNKKLVLSKWLTIGNLTFPSVIDGPAPMVYSTRNVQYSLIDGNYLYALNSNNQSFDVVDISDPDNVTVVSNTPNNSGGYMGIAKSGNYLFVGDSTDDVYSFDVSDPANPTLVDSETLVNLSSARVLFVSGNYLYVVGNDVNVIDISDPENMSTVGNVTMSGDGDYSVKDGNYIYAGGYSGVLSIVDVSNPANPTEVGVLSNFSPYGQFYKQGNYIYAAVSDTNYNYFLDVIDVSNPAAPVRVVDKLDVGLEPSDFAFYGNYMYVGHDGTEGTQIRIVDISNPASASVVGQFGEFLNRQRTLTIVGNHLIAPDSASDSSDPSIKLFSLADPLNPELLASPMPSVDDGYYGKVLVNGTEGYFWSDNDQKFYVMDLSELNDILSPNDTVALQVDGTIQSSILSGSGTIALYADANGNIVPSFSDASLKTNVEDVTSALDKIRHLQGKYFTWKDTARFGTQRELGFIAQEVESYVPEVVRSVGAYKTLNYQNLVALQNEGIKELDVRLSTVESLAGIDETSATKSLMARFAEFLKSSTKKIVGGIVEFTGSIFAENATIENGITVKDRATGALTCMTVQNGGVTSIPGACDASAEEQAPAPAPAQEEVVPVPEPEEAPEVTEEQVSEDPAPAPEQTPEHVTPIVPAPESAPSGSPTTAGTSQ